MWLGFGVIICLVMLLEAISFWQSGKIWDNMDYMYRHPFKVNIAVREIQTGVMAIQRSMKNVALAENQEELNSAVHNINLNETEVYRLFDTLYALYLGKRSTIDTALGTYKDWKPIRDETIRLSQAGQQKEAARRTMTEGENHVALIMSKINILRDFALNRAIEFYRSAEKGKNQLYFQLWVMLIILLIFSFVIMTLIMRGITIPLRGLVSFAEHYGNGRYHVRNQYNSPNELGVLATSMNRLAENVHFEITVKNGIMEIADAMLAYDDLPSFCRSVLHELLLITNSNLGAIYFLNEESSMFEPYYSCGFIKENLKSFSADSNEGEFGAVLVGKNATKITQIPDDSVFVFSTVSGSIKPKEQLAVPIFRQGRVIAIVSLANIHTYSDVSLEIIKQSEKNLNMSVNAILAFERIREYAKTLDKQNEKLNNQAKVLQIQSGELLEQNTELDIQKHQIDEANRLKSQFLSSMSHELRTPLNSVIALSGVLFKRLKNQIADEEYSYLEIIERNGKNLLALINDILDLSRIESGKTDIQYNTFSLYDAVQYILVSMQTQIKEKSIEVKNLIVPELPMITSDRDKCHHILQNIIVNAVKFTDTGSVAISAQLVGSEVSVTVKDTGIGIPADQLPHIFDEFRQVDGSTSRQYGGTGLGLAIADKFARKLNARIEVASEPGKGSTFTVIFPFGPSSGKSLPSLAGLKGMYHSESRLPDLKLSEASEKTILIVEDSEPAIVQLSWILKDQGYQIDIARDGFEALASVKSKIPDAIILDLMMPGLDGFEVLERMRSTSENAAIPVLILTAMYLGPDQLKRLTENHIHQLVQKGDINTNELLSIVRRMLFPQGEYQAENNTAQGTHVKIDGPANILIIDDNTDNGTTLKVLLKDKHNVSAIKDGKEGIAKAKSLKPDLILLDISLPGMDGFRVFDAIRTEETLRHIPIIAVTARAMKGDREQILAYGFDDYISKPIDPDVLKETISKWIS